MGLLGKIAAAVEDRQVQKEESDLADRRAPTINQQAKPKGSKGPGK